MTSEERHEARYRRRKEKRRLKRQKIQENLVFEQMFSFSNWLTALRKCKKTVSWKGSVQWYMQHPLERIIDFKSQIQQMRYPYRPNEKRIILYERGKARYIVPITIDKRHVEHVFCDNILIPAVIRRLIMDNGASLDGKGTQFSRDRITDRLTKAVKEYGTDFYYWQFDFKSFFESIPLALCKRELFELFDDRRTIGFAVKCLSDYHLSKILRCTDPEERAAMQREFDAGRSRGICLGSQISQMLALIVPNKLDHFITNGCGFRYYERYMDDGIVFHKSKAVLQKLYNSCKELCRKLGLQFSEKKTKICRISKGFTFLKVHYYLSTSGKIFRKIHKSSPVRMRRKLKRFRHLLDEGRIRMDNIFDAFQSWYNHCRKVAKTYRTRKEMLGIYKSLFGNYGLDKLQLAS